MHLRFSLLAAVACTAALPAQLSGTYTIDPSGAANFRSFTEAVNAMFVAGINGPVDVAVLPGTYTESVLVPPIPGTDQHRITFRAVVGAGTVQLNGAAGNTFALLGVAFAKNSSITWDGFDFVSAPGHAISGSTFCENMEIRNCTFGPNHRANATGEFRHALIVGESSGSDGGWHVHHNTFTVPNYTNRTTYGIYLQNGGGWDIHDNEWDLNGCTYGIYLINNNRTLDKIWNNLFYGSLYATTSTSFSSVAAVKLDVSNYDNDVVHNTFLVTIPTTGCLIATGGLSGTSPATNRIHGNIMMLTGAGTCIVASSSTVPIVSDGNVFWAPAGEVGRVGSNATTSVLYQNLAAWQSGAGVDTASVEADPLFLSTGTPLNLRVAPGSPSTNLAVNTPVYVTTDFDGRLRDATPDAGAFESTSFAIFGSGCPGTGGLVPMIGSSGTVALGSTNFSVDLSNAAPNTLAILIGGVSRTMAGPIALPFDLGGGCFVRTSQEAAFTGVTTAQGTAFLPLPIPSNPQFVGTDFFLQWAVFDPNSASPFGVTTSDAGALQI